MCTAASVVASATRGTGRLRPLTTAQRRDAPKPRSEAARTPGAAAGAARRAVNGSEVDFT